MLTLMIYMYNNEFILGRLKMKSFVAKQVMSIFVNLIYLRLKLLKYNETNRKICDTVDHNYTEIYHNIS